MHMPEQLETAFNKQVTMELESSNAYLQLAAWLAHENLDGMSSWMRQQAEEERQHADRFLDFVLDRGGLVLIGDLAAPSAEFETPLAAFQAALAQEEAVTKSIHDLFRLSQELGDLSSLPLLQEFIDEQNEEEATVGTIVDRLRLANGHSGALLLLDRELGERQSE